jgi:hypothetical protein
MDGLIQCGIQRLLDDGKTTKNEYYTIPSRQIFQSKRCFEAFGDTTADLEIFLGHNTAITNIKPGSMLSLLLRLVQRVVGRFLPWLLPPSRVVGQGLFCS